MNRHYSSDELHTYQAHNLSYVVCRVIRALLSIDPTALETVAKWNTWLQAHLRPTVDQSVMFVLGERLVVMTSSEGSFMGNVECRTADTTWRRRPPGQAEWIKSITTALSDLYSELPYDLNAQWYTASRSPQARFSNEAVFSPCSAHGDGWINSVLTRLFLEANEDSNVIIVFTEGQIHLYDSKRPDEGQIFMWATTQLVPMPSVFSLKGKHLG